MQSAPARSAEVVSGKPDLGRLPLPPPPIGRALIVAFGLAVLAGMFSGCEAATWTPEIRACAEMCHGSAASFAVEFVPFAGSSPKCVCRDLADGGRP